MSDGQVFDNWQMHVILVLSHWQFEYIELILFLWSPILFSRTIRPETTKCCLCSFFLSVCSSYFQSVNRSKIFKVVQVISITLESINVNKCNSIRVVQKNDGEPEQEVFRRRGKVGRDGAEVTLSGRLFQMVGPD